MGFSVTCYGKIQMNFLATSIHILNGITDACKPDKLCMWMVHTFPRLSLGVHSEAFLL